LQDRLAQRLQVARAQGVGQSWLAVESAASKIIIPLAQAGEIFPYSTPQPVPYTQPWFLGVSNLRGGLFSVVDFAVYTTGKPRVATNDFGRSEMRLVVLNSAMELNCALVIDRLLGLRNAQSFTQAVERSDDDPDWVERGLVDQSGAKWLELNVRKLTQTPSFLSVGT
jgi:twitching motility protein PilI